MNEVGENEVLDVVAAAPAVIAYDVRDEVLRVRRGPDPANCIATKVPMPVNAEA
jgi:hypothetical protein